MRICKTVAAAIALLAASTAFGGPKAPENWQPKKIMGRDFYAPAGGNIDNWPTNMAYSTVPL